MTPLGRAWLRLRRGLLIYASLLPALWLAGAAAGLKEDLALGAAAVFLPLHALCALLRGGRRVLLCAGVTLLWAGCGRLLPGAGWPWLATLPLCASLWLTARFSALPDGWELPAWIGLGGAALYAAAQLGRGWAVRTGEAWNGSALLTLALPVSFIPFLYLWLCAMNRENLSGSGVSGRTPDPSIRRRNRALTLLLATAALTLGSISRLWEALTWAVARIRDGVTAFFDWLSSLITWRPADGAAEAGNGGGLPFPGGAPERAESPFLQKLLMILALLIGAAVLVYALFQAGRAAGRLTRRLVRWLRRQLAVASRDYVDETTDLRQERRQTRRQRSVERRRRYGTAPRQKVRRQYYLLMDRHRDWRPGSTAREHLRDEAVIYEKARYSGHEVTEAEAEAFRGMASRR